jgi:hypothetical protein
VNLDKKVCSLSQAFDKIKEKDFDILLTVEKSTIQLNWL